MTDAEVMKLREEYESSGQKILQFATQRGMDFEKARYALRKALKLRREANGEVTFTSIQTGCVAHLEKLTIEKNIVITTTNGTVIQIPS